MSITDRKIPSVPPAGDGKHLYCRLYLNEALEMKLPFPESMAVGRRFQVFTNGVTIHCIIIPDTERR